MRRARYAVLFSLSLLATEARAQDQRAAAQVLFEQGRSLVAKKKYAEACPKFTESLRLDPGIGTMLWLADCLESAGQSASAWAEFKEAAAAAALKSDAREKIARQRAAALEPKLSRITIVVPSASTAADLEIRRDGVVVGAPEWGVAVPLDPGMHTIAATAPAHRPWSTDVRLAPASAAITVTIPSLDPAPVAPPPPPPETTAPPPIAPPPSPPPPEQADASTGSTQRVIGLAVAGAGVIGAGVGAVFVIRAKSTYDKSNQNNHCLPDNECDPTGKGLRNDAKSMAAVATIAIIAGAAAIVGGGVLYLTAPRARVRAAIAPGVLYGTW